MSFASSITNPSMSVPTAVSASGCAAQLLEAGLGLAPEHPHRFTWMCLSNPHPAHSARVIEGKRSTSSMCKCNFFLGLAWFHSLSALEVLQ